MELAALATAIGSAAAGTGTVAAAGTAAAAALPTIGTILSTGATVAGGIAANKAAKGEAKALQKQGAEEEAMGSRAAEERRRQTELVLSRQIALAADSGAGTDNASIDKIYTDTAQQGSYLARADYEAGKRQSDGMMDRAAAAKLKGKNALYGSILDGAGTAFKGFGARKSYS